MSIKFCLLQNFTMLWILGFHLNTGSSVSVSQRYWFWCHDKQHMWGYKHEKFSNQFKNRELGNMRIPRSVGGHTSPLLANDITHLLWDAPLEETWNLRRTPITESFSGKAQALRNCTWERNGNSNGWPTKQQTSCKLFPATSLFVLTLFCVEN